jgi:hypothetical protein
VTLDRLAAVLDDDRLDPWLRRGLRVWTRLGGALPLEKCLRLPRGARSYARAERDRWLRVAFAHVGTAAGLADAIHAQRWRFPLWKTRGEPATLSPIQAALYNAWLTGASLDLCPRQLQRIVGGRGAPNAMSAERGETSR